MIIWTRHIERVSPRRKREGDGRRKQAPLGMGKQIVAAPNLVVHAIVAVVCPGHGRSSVPSNSARHLSLHCIVLGCRMPPSRHARRLPCQLGRRPMPSKRRARLPCSPRDFPPWPPNRRSHSQLPH